MTTVVFVGVVFLAFVTEAALGFGATVVTVTLAAFVLPIEVILPAFVPVNVLLSAWLAGRYSRHVDRRLLLRRVLPLMALGLPFGMWLFHGGGSGLLHTLFGVFVVVLSALELLALRVPRGERSYRARSRGRSRSPVLRAARWRRPLAPVLQVVLLVLAGVTHGAWATGGPLAVYVAGREVEDKRVFRATLSALWLLLNIALLAGYLVAGDLDGASLERSALLLVPLLLGLVVGQHIHDRVDGASFRRLVFGMLLVAGAVLALRG